MFSCCSEIFFIRYFSRLEVLVSRGYDMDDTLYIIFVSNHLHTAFQGPDAYLNGMFVQHLWEAGNRSSQTFAFPQKYLPFLTNTPLHTTMCAVFSGFVEGCTAFLLFLLESHSHQIMEKVFHRKMFPFSFPFLRKSGCTSIP